MVRQDSHLYGCSTADYKGLAGAILVTADSTGVRVEFRPFVPDGPQNSHLLGCSIVKERRPARLFRGKATGQPARKERTLYAEEALLSRI